MLFISALAMGASAFLHSHRHGAVAHETATCKDIAGTYQFVETVNEYDNSEVGTGLLNAAEDPTILGCNGGVGFLHIERDCTWTYKKLKNDPHVCEDDSGFSQSPVKRTEVEYWTIRRFNTQSSAANVGAWIEDIVFTIEHIPGFLHGKAKRIQGVIEKINGCDLSFEGWEVDRADVNHCEQGFSQGRQINFNKRAALEEESARLTSSSSSASASDIKDALAKIAAALPATFDTTSSSSDDTTSEEPACKGIAGIYQFVETVNEFDNSELTGTAFTTPSTVQADPTTTDCSGGIGFLDIHEDCEWIYKKIVVGGNEGQYCIDDAGFDESAVAQDETEFYNINREGVDRLTDFRFSIEKLAGDKNAPTRIQGIVEKDNGCDLAFEGWLTDRRHLHACRDAVATI
jgi:hypothetical protein